MDIDPYGMHRPEDQRQKQRIAQCVAANRKVTAVRDQIAVVQQIVCRLDKNLQIADRIGHGADAEQGQQQIQPGKQPRNSRPPEAIRHRFAAAGYHPRSSNGCRSGACYHKQAEQTALRMADTGQRDPQQKHKKQRVKRVMRQFFHQIISLRKQKAATLK